MRKKLKTLLYIGIITILVLTALTFLFAGNIGKETVTSVNADNQFTCTCRDASGGLWTVSCQIPLTCQTCCGDMKTV